MKTVPKRSQLDNKSYAARTVYRVAPVAKSSNKLFVCREVALLSQREAVYLPISVFEKKTPGYLNNG